MISDILAQALTDMEEHWSTEEICFYDSAEKAMIEALRGHMRAVLRYLDVPPFVPAHNGNADTGTEQARENPR